MKYVRVLFFGLLFALALVPAAHAADFHAVPATGTYGLGSRITLNIRIDTSGATVNAAQATMTFDSGLLEVESISKVGSVFNFWLQEPEFSNTAGTIAFIGGTANGVSGQSLQVLQVVLTAKGIGSSGLVFSDAAITAADGTGTNILANTGAATYTISGGGASAPPVGTPVPITRAPTVATASPVIPVVQVPLYPNPGDWYSVAAPFAASWVLPSDISGISTAVNTDPHFVPPAVSEGLFEAKVFPAIGDDGIYYLHVRFRNDKGWGPTVHHRIALDSQPSLPLTIDVTTGLANDNPSPVLSFATTDALSGLSHYEVFVNAEAVIVASNSMTTLSPRPPGEYVVRVKAVDRAGNGIEDTVNLEILPIEPPTIHAINRKVVTGTDDALHIRGSAIPNATVIVTITDSSERLVLQDTSPTDAQGLWEYRLDEEMRLGDYLVSVKARDSRGALSLATTPVEVSFVEKPIVSLFGWDITPRVLIAILVVIGICAAILLGRSRAVRRAKSQRQSVIMSRDLRNALDAVKQDLDEIAAAGKAGVSAKTRDLQYATRVGRIKDSLDKLDMYLGGDIKKLG